MTEERKAQLGISVDANPATQGFQKIAAGAQTMAQGVAQAGKQAGEGLDKVGDGAKRAADALTREEARMSASIKRATFELQTFGKTAAEKLEAKVAFKGLDPAKFAEQIALLKQLEEAQVRAFAGPATKTATADMTALGASAKQTAFALRGIPAQFTDIVTSLQSGQAPMTVLLQQGGQLKDMFGGIGPAARALGGYIAGLINPLTLTAGAVGVLAVAAHQGSEELRAFQNAATLTGNAIGLSASGFSQMRDSLVGIAGTKGKAAEALTEIARNGQIAGANVRGIAEAAILLEKATGQAISKTVGQFAQLRDAPVTAAVELNKQYNFLTSAVYAQMKALEEAGRASSAADIAEKALADTLSKRSQDILANSGLLEKGWRSVATAAKKAWDEMLGIGRETTIAEKLQKNADDLARIRAQIAGVGAFGETGGGAATGGASAANAGARKLQAEALAQEQQSNFRKLEIEQGYAAAQAATSQADKERIAAVDKLTKANDQYASKTTQLTKALGDYRRELDKIRSNPNSSEAERKLLDPKTIAQTEAGIRKQFTDTTGQSEVAGILAKVTEQRAYLERLKQQLISGVFTDTTKLTEGEKLVLKIQEELKTSINGTARAEKERALAAAKVQSAVDQQVVAQEKQNEAVKKSQELTRQQAEDAGKQADAIRQQAIEQEAANAQFGKSKSAIEEARLAQMRLQLTEAQESSAFAPAYVAALQQKTAAQEQYLKALREGEFIQKGRALQETARVSAEDAQTLQLEFSLAGQTAEVRERILALRKVEIALAKELAEIDKIGGQSPEDEARRQELRAQARANAVVEANTAANRKVLDEWQRTADSINSSLTDALMRAFESGEGFGKSLASSLKSIFNQMVLRPVISAALNPISSAISGVVGGASSSLMSSLGLGSIGSSLGGGIGSLFGGGTAAAEAAGFWTGGSTAAASTGALGSLSGVLGPIGLGLAALSLFGKSGETRSGGQYSGTSLLQGPSGGEISGDQVRQSIASTMSSIDTLLQTLGSSTRLSGFQSGLESSSNGRGGVFAGGTLSTGAAFGESGQGSNYAGTLYEKFSTQSPDAQTALTNFGTDLVQATLQALQADLDNLPEYVGRYLKGIDIEALSSEAGSAMLAAIQGVVNQRLALEDRIFQLTATDAEKLTKTRDAERKTIDASNQALLDRVYSLEDEKTATEKLVAAQKALTESLAPAINAVTEARKAEREGYAATVTKLRDYAKGLRDFRDSLLLSAQSPLTPGQKYSEARNQLDAAVALARTGDETAIGKIRDLVSQFLEASSTFNASGAGFTSDFGYAQTILTEIANSSSAAADVQQLMLDAADAQLSALGVVNSSVLTVAQAVAALGDKITAAIASGMNPGAASIAALSGGIFGQSVSTSAGNVYADTPGAAALGGTIYAANGNSYTFAEAQRLIINAIDAGATPENWRKLVAQYGVSRESMLKLLAGTGYENRLPAFGGGGDFGGGYAIAGEYGREIIATGQARIFNASQTKDILGGGPEMLACMNAVLDAVRSLKDVSAQGLSSNVAATLEAADKISATIGDSATQTRWKMQQSTGVLA